MQNMETLLGRAAAPDNEQEARLEDRLWPDDKDEEAGGVDNSHMNELPLSYRLWPDEDWPPRSLFDLPASPAVQKESDRLFRKFYQREKDNWD